MSFRWPEIKLPGSAKRRPEDSIELRAWVLAAVLVGEAAVLTSGYFGAVTGVLVPFLTVVAFVVSYLRRRERNILIKVMLAFCAMAAMTQMNLSEARERAGVRTSRSSGLMVGTVVPCFFAVIAVGLVCFS